MVQPNMVYLNDLSRVKAGLIATVEKYLLDYYPDLVKSNPRKPYRISSRRIMFFFTLDGVHGEEGYNRALTLLRDFVGVTDISQLLEIVMNRNRTGTATLFDRIMTHLVYNAVVGGAEEAENAIYRKEQAIQALVPGVMFSGMIFDARIPPDRLRKLVLREILREVIRQIPVVATAMPLIIETAVTH